nr:peptidase domain-containing ABC transporter [Brevundimonas variabilis]
MFPTRGRLPVIHQVGAAECGLACMAMISWYHGNETDLSILRRRFSVSLSGARLSDLINFADRMNLSARPVRLDLDALGRLALPAVLHWDMNHFVVLKSVGKTSVTIHDPANGARVVSKEELSRHFTGVALEVGPREDFLRTRSTKLVTLVEALGDFSIFRRALPKLLVLSLAIQLLSLLPPLLMQIIIDESSIARNSDIVLSLSLASLFVVLVTLSTTAIRSWITLYFTNLINYSLVGRTFERLMALPAYYFERRSVGDIISRMLSIKTIQSTITDGAIQSLLDGVLGLVTLAVLFAYDVRIGLVAAGSVLALALSNQMFASVIRSGQEQSLATAAEEQSHLMESIRAANVIKMFGQESMRLSKWRNRYLRLVNANLGVGRSQIAMTAVNDAIGAFQLIAVIYILATGVISGDLTVGMFAAVLAYRQSFAQSVARLIVQLMQFRLIRLHLDRLGDIIHHPLDPASAPTAEQAAEVASYPKIELVDVSFRYGDTDPWLLRKVSLSIEPGSFVAIVGPSGTGKSTLARLMLGLLEPTSGEIFVNGRPLKGSTLRNWRASLGVVLQNDKLFTGTLAENISFFAAEVDPDRLAEVGRLADIHEAIMDMPMAYQTMVGDMGSTLSAGQYQRVLLARALYRNPKFLLLDEGTANLDPATEHRIVQSVSDMALTRVVVAHRPALVEAADVILRVAEGAVARVERPAP